MKRRAVLVGGACLSASFVAGCSLIPVIPRRPAPTLDDARGWVRHAAGRYTLLLPRIEMGQQVSTALKQVACEELGIDWDRLQVQLPDTGAVAPVRATVGSDSLRDFMLPLAQACAALREALAAGRTEGELQVQPRAPSELRAWRRGARFVGQRVPIEHGVAIVRGETLFAADVRRPGRAFGRVLRASASPELPSRPLAFDAGAARAQPGFVALVTDPALRQGAAEGLGIVAETPGALDRIEQALALRWQVDGTFQPADVGAMLDIDHRLASAGGGLAHALRRDSLDAEAPWTIDLRFDIPAAAHGQIEARAAVAEFDAGGALSLWTGTQDAFYVRDVLARTLGLASERVAVHPCRIGGAFGGRTLCTVELEAALLARAARRPVLVQWQRAQELQHGFHRPPSSHRIRARLADGRLQDWWHAFSSGHILLTNAAMPAWMQAVAERFAGDDGVARGALLPYRVPRRRIEFDLVRLPVLAGPWRGLGAGPNHLAIESAIDECARAAGADPLRFRLQHLDDDRLARVLLRAAEAAGWGAARPAQAAGGLRRGRGLAAGVYKVASRAAVVADVDVDPEGRVQVRHLVCAHDCGLVVNPDQVRAQCEGNLVWGLGMVLGDELPLVPGGVAGGGFAAAPIPAFTQLPTMEVVLVDDGTQPPAGAGETAIVAAAAAIANAVRDATGVRPTRFPLRPPLSR